MASLRAVGLLVLASAVLGGAQTSCRRPAEKPLVPSATTPALPPPPPPPPVVSIEAIGEPAAGSTVALGKVDGHTFAFVADEDAHTVRAVDAATMQEVGSFSLGGRPSQLLVTKAGRLWVALRDEASVAVLAAHADRTLTREATIVTAAEPIALAPGAADGKAVLVASGWGHALERFDATTLERTLEVSLPREPRAVLASRDGENAYVAYAAEGFISTVHVQDAKIANVDLGNPGAVFATKSPVMMMSDIFVSPANVDGAPVARHIHVPRRPPMAQTPATFARQGYALARLTLTTSNGEAERVLLPHADMITGDPKVISSGYGGGGIEGLEVPTEQFSVSSIDVATGKRMASRNAEQSSAHPCRLPRSAVTVDNMLLVACLGENEIAAYKVEDGTRFVRAVSVPAGPTGVAVDPETKSLYAFSLFDATLTETSLAAFTGPEKTSARTLRFDRPSGLADAAESGRRIFFASGDPRISKDGRACASCHPDGRDDGLVWSTPNGPRQTISLAARVRHEAPFGWMAKHPSLQEHMRTTMKNLKGKGLEPGDEGALASWLVAMPGPPTKTHTLTPEEEQGRTIFASAGAECSSCHGGPDTSDHEAHDVKSATASDKNHDFLAPSLAGIGGTAPYFHDGRYASLEELLEKSDGKMGSVEGLSPDQRSALVAYLRTL
jgi:DNA-binding beta-propeller fold protein YncE